MQQIPFIGLFKSAVHVSGDKLAQTQDHFLTVYTAFDTHSTPLLLPTGDKVEMELISSISILSPVGSSVGVEG